MQTEECAGSAVVFVIPFFPSLVTFKRGAFIFPFIFFCCLQGRELEHQVGPGSRADEFLHGRMNEVASDMQNKIRLDT